MDATAARLTIDLDALAHNHAVLRKQAGRAEVAPVVKADGYGLGSAQLAQRLWREGARTFFVARLAEGEALRAALGPEAVILVLDGCPPGGGDRLLAANLVPVLNSLEQIDAFAAAARDAGRGAPVALHVDTGMSRLGLRPQEARALAADPDRLAAQDLILLVSHYACADEPAHPKNAEQAALFAELRGLFPQARASLANSGGLFLGGELYDVVRPGICMYGGGPTGVPDARLRPVARLEAAVLQVREVEPGETVGYSATFTANRPMRVAVIAAGYADGVLRATSPNGSVWFDGAPRALLGRVSMDLIAVDVTGCAAVAPGDMMEIFGPNMPLDDVASAAGAVAYEYLVRLSPRLERVYVD